MSAVMIRSLFATAIGLALLVSGCTAVQRSAHRRFTGYGGVLGLTGDQRCRLLGTRSRTAAAYVWRPTTH